MNTNVLTVLQLFLNKLGKKIIYFLALFSEYDETWQLFTFFKEYWSDFPNNTTISMCSWCPITKVGAFNQQTKPKWCLK